jgi:hypothetical protein
MSTHDAPSAAAPALAGFPSPAAAGHRRGHWQREVAALVSTGEMNLSVLFAAPATSRRASTPYPTPTRP